MSEPMTLQTIREAVAGTAAAFRSVTEYQPAGGPGDKVFPPTYEGGKYATETRILAGGEIAECVLLDSVQSQANRMELALLEAHRAKRAGLRLPLLVTRFDEDRLLKKFTVTSLEAPHRIADAIFRDSLWDGVMFRKSAKGAILDTADVRNATGLFGLCPTALVFGLWDSTGPRGGLGAKFQRAMVSEIVGVSATPGRKTGSRIDPAQILKDAAVLYDRNPKTDSAPDWTMDSAKGSKKLGKDGRPSEANHGNVVPGISDGGYTISRALQTTVLSLTAIRRLRFPLAGAAESDLAVDNAARTVLVTLCLAAAALIQDESADLRSRCHLVATSSPVWELLEKPGQEPRQFRFSADEAIALLNEATRAARDMDLPWEGEIELKPHADLIELVRRSQELAASSAGET